MSDDNSQRDWREEIENIYNSFSVAVDGANFPGGRKEVLAAQEKLDEMKGEFKSDGEFTEQALELQKELDYSGKRHFYGPKFVLIGVLIGILVVFYMSGKADRKAGKLLIDDAERIQMQKIDKLNTSVKMDKDQVEYYENYINKVSAEVEEYKEGEMTNQIKERIAEREKNIAKAEKDLVKKKADLETHSKDLEELKSMTAEEYRDYKREQDMEVADSASNYGWRTVMWFLIILAASFVPGYTINKREARRTSQGNKFLSMIFTIMGSGQTVRYRRADGSTYDDYSGHLGAFAAALAILLTSIILIVIMLPYVAAFMVIRNIVLPQLS